MRFREAVWSRSIHFNYMRYVLEWDQPAFCATVIHAMLGFTLLAIISTKPIEYKRNTRYGKFSCIYINSESNMSLSIVVFKSPL